VKKSREEDSKQIWGADFRHVISNFRGKGSLHNAGEKKVSGRKEFCSKSREGVRGTATI